MLVKLLKITPNKDCSVAHVDVELMPIHLKIKGIPVIVRRDQEGGKNQSKHVYAMKMPQAPLFGKKDPKTHKQLYYSVVSWSNKEVYYAFFKMIEDCITRQYPHNEWKNGIKVFQ